MVSRLTSVLERNIQIELYRVLQNLIEKRFSFNEIEFVGVRYEPTINGRPDLVVEAIDKGKKMPILVIETKRKVPFVDRKFDPYSKDVIRQASGYAVELGAPYFATCNGEVLVVFDTFTAGVPLPQRRLKHYRVYFEEAFAKTILEEVCRFRIGVGKWLELDDVFIQRLRTFHNFITPFVLESLDQKLQEDAEFKEEYVRWLKSQLFEYSPQMTERIAEQLAYMLMNRLTFYKTLETQISTLPKLTKVEVEDPKAFSERLREVFDKVYRDVDYEAIFEPHRVLDQILFSKKLIYALNDFIEELGTYNLAKIRSDIIGRVYEELIPDVERHRLGQYYTPPPIVELITEMCVKSPEDRVLDPGCGSGGFLVKAYHKLKDLKKRENPFAEDSKLHEEILNQLYGIDINAFPAQLSSINLAVRNLKVASRNINLIVSDFFKVKPSTPILPREFDVVVTNPPYTRQEEMEYKDQIREEALSYSDGTKIDISAQAGIYAYFFTHSAKFLKNAGKMGYITSSTWLDVSFGEELKQFFLDHFRILTVIEHDAGVFERAIIDTCVTILEKYEGDDYRDRRENNVVKFTRVKKPMDISKIIQTIESTTRAYEDEGIRIIPIKQGELKASDKWGRYLRAPLIYAKIKEHPLLTELNQLCSIRRGLTTGADKFFYFDKGKIKLWGIEKQYLKPAITQPQQLKSLMIDEAEIDEYVLMVHDDKSTLKEIGSENVWEYIRQGEKTETRIQKGKDKGKVVVGYQNLSTIKPRKNWYDLGKRKPSPILFPKLKRGRIFFTWNKANAYVDDSIYEITPLNKAHTLEILAILNSSITELIIESIGRTAGRGLLATMVYEVKTLPVLDVRKLKNETKMKLEKAFLELCKSMDADENSQKIARERLDSIIFDVLGFSRNERKRLYEGLESLRRMRLQRKEVEVLVETAEKWKPPKKPKKERIKRVEPSKRLDTWMPSIR